MNILLAEDETDIRELLVLHLSKEGYTIYEAGDGLAAVEMFKNNEIHLALLDINMPKLDGYKVLAKIREDSNIPVIFLTAKSEDTDKILGLGLGADDYITKPFSPIEVIARVKAHFRRYFKFSSTESKEVLVNGELKIDKESYSFYKKDVHIELNAKEYRIIELLMENPGKVFTKKQLYEKVWEESYFGDDNTIMVHMSHLRDKLEDDPKHPKYLKTIRGIGYKVEKL